MKTLLLILFAAMLSNTAFGASIRMTFIDNSDNETGFNMERRNVDAGGEFEVIGAIWSEDPTTTGETRFVDKEAITGVLYEYRCNAHNENGFSGYSNTMQAIAKGGPKAPTIKSLEQVPTIKYSTDANGNPVMQFVD